MDLQVADSAVSPPDLH